MQIGYGWVQNNYLLLMGKAEHGKSSTRKDLVLFTFWNRSGVMWVNLIFQLKWRYIPSLRWKIHDLLSDSPWTSKLWSRSHGTCTRILFCYHWSLRNFKTQEMLYGIELVHAQDRLTRAWRTGEAKSWFCWFWRHSYQSFSFVHCSSFSSEPLALTGASMLLGEYSSSNMFTQKNEDASIMWNCSINDKSYCFQGPFRTRLSFSIFFWANWINDKCTFGITL